MADGLKLVLGADIKEAQAALKTVVADAKVAGKQVEKSFGNARLPLGDIKAYTASIQNLKQNLSQVTLAPLTQGISGTGEAATETIPKIGGLIASLGKGALLGVVVTLVGVLKDAITSMFDTADAISQVTIESARLESRLKALGDSFKNLESDLDFLNKIAKLKDEIAGVTGVTLDILDLKRQKEKDKILIESLEEDGKKVESELLKIQARVMALTGLNIGTLTRDEQGLISPDIIGELKDGDFKKQLTDFNKLLKDKQRIISESAKATQSLLLNDAGIQKAINDDITKDEEKAEADREKRLKASLAARLKYLAELKRLRELEEALLRSRNTGDAQNTPVTNPVNIPSQIVPPSRNSLAETEARIQSSLTSGDGVDIPARIKVDDADSRNAFDGISADAERLGETINGILTPAFDGLFQAIQAGENPLKAFFEGLGQAVLQLIQKLIQAAVTAAILSAILPGGGGGFGALFGKFLGLAGGGLVSGPTLAAVGEGSGTNLSNPEVVAPLDQLKAMLGDIGTGGSQVVVMRTQISGNNLSLVQARTSRRNKRLGATG